MRIIAPTLYEDAFMIRCNCGVQFARKSTVESVYCAMCHRREPMKPMLAQYVRRNKDEQEIKL